MNTELTKQAASVPPATLPFHPPFTHLLYLSYISFAIPCPLPRIPTQSPSSLLPRPTSPPPPARNSPHVATSQPTDQKGNKELSTPSRTTRPIRRVLIQLVVLDLVLFLLGMGKMGLNSDEMSLLSFPMRVNQEVGISSFGWKRVNR